jgi:hypothetical protein
MKTEWVWAPARAGRIPPVRSDNQAVGCLIVAIDFCTTTKSFVVE